MKKSKLLLAAAILGTLYIVYLISYFVGGVSSSEGAEAVGAGIATAIVMPHMLLVALAVIFNWIGWLFNARWGALTAGILYAVSILMMFIYAIFVILQMIFCFVAFAKMKSKEAKVSE